uniref:Cation diffusion facilitator family transporter n=1 Tax=Heterorhabditis bacteriophora TaxID=37862 RepID=A0A1I7WWZ9_HETBA
MQPFSKSWYYWAVLVLLIVQVVLSINYHVLICNMPIANTLLLLVIMAHHGYALGEQARPLFHRICGCVAFIAVLFVNTTHALELLTDYGEDDHGHSHEISHDLDSDDNHIEHSYGFVPKPYVIVSIFDVCLKCLILALGHIPPMGLHPFLRIILHTLSPSTVIGKFFHMLKACFHYLVITYFSSAFTFTIMIFIILLIFYECNDFLGMYTLGLVIPDRIGETWMWKHIDPLVAVIMTMLFFGLIIPAFREMMPYIFADTPEKFQVDTFQDEISTTFTDVTCTHIHAYRLWPGNVFEALIHINIRVDKSQERWSEAAATRYAEIRQNVNSVLTKAGAQKVVVEPRFIDVTETNIPWVGCIAENCFKQERGCCKGGSSSASSTP